jgi:lactate dehydrogenase-like 2-hydroxyacid dehydrogenase
MANIFVTRPIPEEGLSTLRSRHEVVVQDTIEWSEEELIEAASGADALLSMLSDPITDRVLGALPELSIVAQYAVGVDNIDLEAAASREIVVTHTPGVLTDATADMTLALLLAVSRKLRPADQYVREGKFERWETMLLLGTELRDKTLGIVGMGRIGSAVARRALGFGMDIIYHNRRPANPTIVYELGAEYVSQEALLERSDFVSLHCPLNEESHHLIDAEALECMKSTAYLINTARGAIVDERALVRALDDRTIAGAGLDVFEDEPAVHPGLIASDRVVLAPHLGSATRETRRRMAEMCATSILAALEGREKIPHRIA